MINNLFQFAFINFSSPFITFLTWNIYIMMILNPIAIIINLIALNKIKNHPRKKLKIYTISFILSIIVNLTTAFILNVTGPLILLFLLITLGCYIYLYFKKKKKMQLIFQLISIIIPIIYFLITNSSLTH